MQFLGESPGKSPDATVTMAQILLRMQPVERAANKTGTSYHGPHASVLSARVNQRSFIYDAR